MSATVGRALGPDGAEVQVAVRVQSVTKRFPVRRPVAEVLSHPFRRPMKTVLKAVSVEVRPGELFGLLGPNGAGKTTLFKILATLVEPDGGRATVLGHDVGREPGAVRRVLTPVIADERSLHWRLSAEENLRLFARLYGLRGWRLDSRVEEVMQTVELGDTEGKMVGMFSSGMKQRLLMARALLAEPRVLLLDEPTRSLDPLSARSLRRLLREEIVGRHGCTVLLATHNPEEALGLCDRLAVLHQGRMVATGTARDLNALAGNHRYRLWTAKKDSGLVQKVLEGEGLEWHPGPDEEEVGWRVFDVDLPEGNERAAALLSRLSARQAGIARFERVELTLADLMERIVEETRPLEDGDVVSSHHRPRGGSSG